MYKKVNKKNCNKMLNSFFAFKGIAIFDINIIFYLDTLNFLV